MDFPTRTVALEWVGRTIVDRDGVEIGSCTEVFADDDTGLTEWVRSEVAGVPVFIPAIGAVGSNGNVQVVVSRTEIAAAPPVGGVEHISGDEEIALYQHYGIPYSRDASATVLPEGDVASAQDVTSDAVDPTSAPVAMNSVAAPASAGPVAVGPAAGSVDAAPPAVLPADRTQPVVAAEPDRPGDSAPTSGRGRVKPALAGLAAVAVAAGLVLQARRRRQRAATRAATGTERLADRGRAASAALGARIGPVAASASHYLEATRRTVRRRTGADKVSVDVPADATVEVTAARRTSRKSTG